MGRLAAFGALLLAIVAVGFVLFAGGDSGFKYRLLFETGGQLVEGNQVLVGGTPVGTVDKIELRDDAMAEVSISIDQELHDGTSAVIRSTSLSGVANRYISISPGPDNEPALGDNAVITEVDTTTPVDLDQLFNTIREPERQALRNIIQGSADVYEGKGPQANETYKYLSPSLTATTKLISELNSDQRIFEEFLVKGSRTVTAIAERRDDLSALTSNGNQALGAIANQNQSLDRALRALPPALRQANTTFFNLRPTLDDLDDLVNVAKPTTKNLDTFLRQLRPVVGKSVPVFKDLRVAVNQTGKNNDLADATERLVPLQQAADRASEPTVRALADSEENFEFIRPYAPDLFNTVGKLGQITANYDADGHIARVQPAGMSIFQNNAGSLDPIATNQQFDGYGPFNAAGSNFRYFRRCPGGETQPAPDGSTPFLDAGQLASPADCVVTDVLPGP